MIVYRINRGPRYRLAAVLVNGNRYFSEETIRERLSILPASFPRYRNGRFSPEMLESDRAAIEALYVANGFRDVRVRTRIEHNWRNRASDIAARFEIVEGPQYLVDSVELTGVDLRLYERILSLISSAPGQPYSAANVAADRDAVLNWYFNNGYPEASFDATVTPAADPHRMVLRYQVREGRRTFVRDVLVRGLDATRPELVRSRILVRPGEPLSQSDMVETQRRLYDLGIFAKVDIGVQNLEGRERNKYVLLHLEEGRKYSVSLGFGAEMGRIGTGNNFDAPAGAAGFAPRGLLGITRSNLFGLAHTASALLRVSNIQQRLLLNYLAPQFFGSDRVNLSFSSLLDQSKDIRTFTSRRNESAVQIGQRLSRDITLQYRAISRLVYIDENTLKIAPDLIPVFSQPVRTITISASLIQDRRDDPVDSRRGIANTIDFGFAPRFARSSTNYTRLVARNSTYHPVRREVVFARATSFGWLYNSRTGRCRCRRISTPAVPPRTAVSRTTRPGRATSSPASPSAARRSCSSSTSCGSRSLAKASARCSSTTWATCIPRSTEFLSVPGSGTGRTSTTWCRPPGSASACALRWVRCALISPTRPTARASSVSRERATSCCGGRAGSTSRSG